jgi:hypothetical protein
VDFPYGCSLEELECILQNKNLYVKDILKKINKKE